ncbi:RNA methyltransferase, putative [Babesia ovis]|uniref:RNA methyltransferase, putative n=1 Tax=Babesia ovis TaxID=5869 RepID=A0A9W5T9G0_BABOV|nr:RNA methyltransferase, putative [Babesia ovis]
MDDTLTFNIVRSKKKRKDGNKRREKAPEESRKKQKPGVQTEANNHTPRRQDDDMSILRLLKEIPQRIPFQGKPTGKTFSVALPVSILLNIQTDELRAYVIGTIARTLTIYGIHEIVLYNDLSPDDIEWQEYFAINLRFLETPQYLRKYMFPIVPHLRNTGLQNPLDAPHHLRANEWLPYREGVIKLEEKSASAYMGNLDMLVECGLFGRIKVTNPDALETIYGVQRFCLDTEDEVYQRVTILLDSNSMRECKRRWKEQVSNQPSTPSISTLCGKLVPPDEPQRMAGLYWGYVVREAESYSAIFNNCPFSPTGKYDYTIGTSERGDQYPKDVHVPQFEHMLMVLGPVKGLESIKDNPQDDFNAYVNFCHNQRSRTIRTEEALTICLSQFFAHYSI